MADILAALLFFCALGIGWWMGRRSLVGAKAAKTQDDLQRRIHQVHNLLGRHSNDALESLSQGLAHTPETLESHLHVGSLFRRRGDIEKAIQIHQGLLERAAGDALLVAQIRLELARDFIAGGLLNDAESLLNDLVHLQAPISLQALDEQRLIAEREKDWPRAIALAARLVPSLPELSAGLANYYCELAAEKSKQGDHAAMEALLREARRADRQCVRAILMSLDCQLWQKDYPAAVATMQSLAADASVFLGEVVALLDRHNTLRIPLIHDFLVTLAAAAETPPIVLAALAESSADSAGQWRDRLLQRLEQQPSWQGLAEYLRVAGQQAAVENLTPLILGLCKTMHRYRCGRCGFAGRELHWQCPSCHAWNALRPIHLPH